MVTNNRTYYAQNREDLILEAFFAGRKKGFYVDVGACHPHVASVTKRFYLNGWRGINIEPQKELCHLFDIERPGDINVPYAISNDRGTAKMRAYIQNRGLTTFSDYIKDDYIDNGGDKTDDYEDIAVETIPLRDLFAIHKVKSIQFLKVDVEGYEYQVLESNDWNKYRPEVICIESNHIVKDWHKLLKENNYKKVFFDGLNEYYVDNLLKYTPVFEYVNEVIVKLKGGISSDDVDTINELHKEKTELEKLVAVYEDELVNLRGNIKRAVKLFPKKIKKRLKRR